MKLISKDVDLDAFFERVRCADSRILLLDYDGTLAPFTVQRDEAIPYRGISELLSEILPLPKTRTVIISGRAVADLTGLIGIRPAPEIWGSHGWEHLTPCGQYSSFPLDERSDQKLRQARDFLTSLPYPNLCEEKRVSIAAHWRGLSTETAEVLRMSILNAWSKIAENSQLEIRPFDGGLELRPKGRDKGSAVGEILSQARGIVAAAYLGDDLTDEDAFRAMSDHGLRILVRDTFRETLADVWARPPGDLIAFLTRWKHACAAHSENSTIG